MKLKLTIDGKQYEVEVDVAEREPPHPGYIPPAAAARPNTAAPGAPVAPPKAAQEPVVDEGKVCRSPISGVVVRVSAQPGQAINVNDVLLVLEAMKMETVITSPMNGKIGRVNVQAGDAVKGGQVLVEFE